MTEPEPEAVTIARLATVRGWMDAWDEFKLVPKEFQVHGEHVVMPTRQVMRVRGRGSRSTARSCTSGRCARATWRAGGCT